MSLELLHTTKLRGGVPNQGTLGLARMTGSAHLDYVAGTAATLANRMEVVGWLTVRAYQGSM